MNPVMSVEFTVKAADGEFREESVAIHNPEELFAFVGPGGGCEQIPSEVGEINMVFFRPEHANISNPAIARLVGALSLTAELAVKLILALRPVR